MPGPNFYIYGGGRWREVNITDGRVEGWGRARFAYAKRGKVHVAKTRAVLTALRDLKADRKSAVKDGAHLPFKKIDPPQRREHRYSTTNERIRSNCFHQSANNRCAPHKTLTHSPVKVATRPQSEAKIDAAVQTTQSTPPQTLIFSESSKPKSDKRRTNSTTSNDNVPQEVTTNAMLNSSSNKLNKLKLKKQWSIAGSDQTSPKKIPSLRLNKEDSAKYNIYRRKRTETDDSVVWVVLPKTNETNNGTKCVETKPKQRKRRRSISSGSSQDLRPQKVMRRTKSVANIERKPQSNEKSKSGPNAIKNNRRPTRKSSNTSEDVMLSKMQLDSQTVTKKPKRGNHDKPRTLYIGQKDVKVLRNYLIQNVSDFDLLRFDESIEYKNEFFYSLNPLVTVERCPKIAKMLNSNSQSEISLIDFASQLGLTSITDRKVLQRYKMRKRDVDADKSDYEADKENSNNIRNRVNKRKGAAQRISTTDTEIDSDFQKEKNNSNSLSTRSQNQDVPRTRNRYNTRESGHTKEINRKNDVVDIFSQTTQSAKSDSDSSVEEIKMRVLRKSNTDSTARVDSEGYKETNKTVHNNKMSKTNIMDITKSSDEDSDCVLESEKVEKSSDRFSNRKKIEHRTNSEDKNSKTTKISKRGRDKNGRFRKGKTVGNNNKNDSKEDDSEVEESLKPKTRKQNKPDNKNKTLVDSNDDDSEEEFQSKSRNTSRNKLRDTKNSTNNNNNDISDSEENSEEEFETRSRKEHKRERRNKINDVKNNINNQNNTRYRNDKTSEAEKRIKETKTSVNKQTNNKTNRNTATDSNEKEAENNTKLRNNRNVQNGSNSMFNNSAETLHLSSNDENEVYVKPNPIEETKRRPVRTTRNSDRPAPLQRVEYSGLEDHAIVTWISNGGRARCVNGNRVWVELQDQYQNITGQHRSWHSLRNRYLRSILPRLGQLALSRSLVARLRADAATGEIKSRKGPSRRNSIFAAPVPGALSRRPRARSPSTDAELPRKRHKHDHTRKPSPPPISVRLRSSLPSSPENARRSPRYSEITRHFAAKHRESTPNSESKDSSKERSSSSSSSERESPRKNPLENKKSEKNSLATKKSEENSLATKESHRSSPATRKSKNLSLTKSLSKSTARSNSDRKISEDSSATQTSSSAKMSPARATRQSSATKSLRKSLRESVRDSPAQDRVKSPEKSRMRTRRLYNPNFRI